MDNLNTSETNKPDESDPRLDQEEEKIIFSADEEDTSGPFGKKKKSFGLLKLLAVTGLLIVVYFLGFSTRPDQLDRGLTNLRNLKDWTLKKTRPVKETVSEKVEEWVDTRVGKNSGPSAELPAINDPQRKVKYWKAPMTPGFISDKPGKSPMGMDLVPVYEDEEKSIGGIQISPTMVQNIGVRTEKVRKRNLTREIRTVGRLTYDERQVTHIHTKYEGWIEKLHVDFTGEEVSQDELLVEIYSPELVSTQEELLLALKYNQSLQESPFPEISGGAKSLLDSTRRRLELFDVPEHQIETLIRDKKITKTMHIHSPVRGFVIKKDALQGMYVKPGMSLYTIADLSNIWVLADIYEYELPWIQIGQDVEMTLSYYPGKTFTGKVTFIDPFLEPQTRTLKVRMEFENTGWELKPDMYANVTLKSEIAKQTLAVPEEAVIHAGERNLVIVQKSGGGFESREVNLGAQAKGYYQVLSGLRVGEKIVLSSAFLIDSESRLNEAINKLESPKQVTPAKANNTPNQNDPQSPSFQSSGNKTVGTLSLKPEH